MLRITELRLNKGLNMKEAARLLKIPYTTYVNYEKGLREPNSETLIQLADFYNTSIDYMIGRTSYNSWSASTEGYAKPQDSSPELTLAEKKLISNFRNLNAEGQQKLVEYAADLNASGRYIKTASDRSIPKQA